MFLFYYFLNLLSQILSVCCKEHKLCFTYFSYWGHQERIGHSLKNCPEDIIATAPQTHDLGSSLGEGVCCSLLDCLETYPPTLFWEILPLLMTPFLSEDLRKTQLVVEVLMQKASGATGSPHLDQRSVLIAHENSWDQDGRDSTGRESIPHSPSQRGLWAKQPCWAFSKGENICQVTLLVCKIILEVPKCTTIKMDEAGDWINTKLQSKYILRVNLN